jgi:hypothetical protein
MDSLLLSLSECDERFEEAEDPFDLVSFNIGGLLGRDMDLWRTSGAWAFANNPDSDSFTELNVELALW